MKRMERPKGTPVQGATYAGRGGNNALSDHIDPKQFLLDLRALKLSKENYHGKPCVIPQIPCI